MAQVVLENIYKSFPQPSREQRQRPVANVAFTTLDDRSQGSAELSATEMSATAVLRRINLTVNDGEFMVLVGPSGCGKSTLLRLIAGLESVTGGNVWVGDRLVNTLPPKHRDIAMVFQSYALYPHMTVYDNLAFGLRRTLKGIEISGTGDRDRGNRRGYPRSLPARLLLPLAAYLPKSLQHWLEREQGIDQRVQTVAQMLQIDELLNRFPRQLSGGQKQRVALGRAMARNPQVFLMDEPLSNLDAKLRTETRAQIVNLQRKLGITTLYVTHDQVEAMTMGDRIAVINAGQIQQVATPLELYHSPANRFVAAFIGSPPMNFLPVQVKAPLLISHPLFRLTLPESWEARLHPYDGREVVLGIRPEHLHLGVPALKNLPVQVERVEALGSETYLTVRLHHEGALLDLPPLQVRIEADRPVSLGESLYLSLVLEKIHLFDADSGATLTP